MSWGSSWLRVMCVMAGSRIESGSVLIGFRSIVGVQPQIGER